MEKHRAVIVGAGRIGAGYNWHDDGYTHAGAYLALKDRVELVGFVEKDEERGAAAFKKWGVPWAKKYSEMPEHDIVSVCVQPEHQRKVLDDAVTLKMVGGVWSEKPFVSMSVIEGWLNPIPIQVNYQRRADPLHRRFKDEGRVTNLVVYGKDDETTRCHFRDLARWWNVKLDYRPFNGPCAYIARSEGGHNCFFDNGGINPGECMKGMLANLLDAVEGKAELWSPPYMENT